MKNAREMRADKEIDLEDFQKLKKECEERANELEMKLINCSMKEKGIDELINQAVDKLLFLEDAYSNGTNEEQRSIIGSILLKNGCLMEGNIEHTK